jgi:hypothetical protein
MFPQTVMRAQQEYTAQLLREPADTGGAKPAVCSCFRGHFTALTHIKRISKTNSEHYINVHRAFCKRKMGPQTHFDMFCMSSGVNRTDIETAGASRER